MDKVFLPKEEMLPHIFLARKYDTRKIDAKKTQPRTAIYYENSIYLSDGGTVVINDVSHNIKKGDVRFTRPGDVCYSEPHFSCCTIYFDLGKKGISYSNEILDSIPSFFHLKTNVVRYFEEVIYRYGTTSPISPVVMNSYVLRIISEYYNELHIAKNRSAAVNTCLAYIEENFHTNITLETLSKISGYSSLHLLRLFKSDIGISPHEHLTSVRINHAKHLLINSVLPLSDIAFMCGFQSDSHFKSLFKSRTGISPGKFRKDSHILI